MEYMSTNAAKSGKPVSPKVGKMATSLRQGYGRRLCLTFPEGEKDGRQGSSIINQLI